MINHFLKIIFLLVAVLFATDAFCQKNNKKKKKPEESKTKEIQVFGEENEDYFKDGDKPGTFNIIKLEPLMVILGDFPISYERVLNQHFAIEPQIGITLKPKYAWAFTDILNEEISDFEELTPKIGFLGGLTLKYYVGSSDDAPEGFYMGIGARYKKYNATTFGFDEFGNRQYSGSKTYSTPLSVTDLIRVTTGWGVINDNFFSDFFLGFGLRQRSLTKDYALVNPNTGLVETAFTTEKTNVPAFLLGYKIGFTF